MRRIDTAKRKEQIHGCSDRTDYKFRCLKRRSAGKKNRPFLTNTHRGGSDRRQGHFSLPPLRTNFLPHTLFEAIPLTDQDTLLDYGSGLGRLSFYTNHRFHNGAIGIELSETFHREALKNLNQYRGVHRERLAFVHGKAEDFAIPDEVTTVYCFNPFSTDIFRKVLTNIEKSYENKPRKVTLILYYPEDNTIFYIERHTGFRLVNEIAVPELFEGDRREKFCIYELSE